MGKLCLRNAFIKMFGNQFLFIFPQRAYGFPELVRHNAFNYGIAYIRLLGDEDVPAAGKGTATITAEIINADGATVTATKEISCTMTLWQRIVRWFKGLFGAARLMKAIEH